MLQFSITTAEMFVAISSLPYGCCHGWLLPRTSTSATKCVSLPKVIARNICRNELAIASIRCMLH
jgi:hypothetical protein